MALLPFANAPGGASINVSAGATSHNLSNVVFSNSNNAELLLKCLNHYR